MDVDTFQLKFSIPKTKGATNMWTACISSSSSDVGGTDDANHDSVRSHPLGTSQYPGEAKSATTSTPPFAGIFNSTSASSSSSSKAINTNISSSSNIPSSHHHTRRHIHIHHRLCVAVKKRAIFFSLTPSAVVETQQVTLPAGTGGRIVNALWIDDLRTLVALSNHSYYIVHIQSGLVQDVFSSSSSSMSLGLSRALVGAFAPSGSAVAAKYILSSALCLIGDKGVLLAKESKGCGA